MQISDVKPLKCLHRCIILQTFILALLCAQDTLENIAGDSDLGKLQSLSSKKL